MMRVAGYEFSDGFRPQAGAEGDPNEVGKHIDFLREQAKGELQPVDVVNDARNPNSPLHSFFEWDDTKAAQEHRLAQARVLIRAVVAIYVDDERPATRVKAFVHIAEPGAPHYRSVDHAMSQEKTRAMVLQRAWREFVSWRQRYKDLKEFADLFAAADQVAKKLPKPKVNVGH